MYVCSGLSRIQEEWGKIYRLEINYHVISLVDNEEYLQTDNKLHSFQEMREQQGGSEDFLMFGSRRINRILQLVVCLKKVLMLST